MRFGNIPASAGQTLGVVPMDQFGPLMDGTLPWRELLAEFAPIPSLINRISPDDRAYETKQMIQEPAYLLMERLLADLTVVYAPPKVGGQTIAATLWAHPDISQPKHIHFMSPKGLAFMEWLIEKAQSNPNQHEWRTLMAHGRWVRVLMAAKRMLRAAGLTSIVSKPMLIAGVREPMGQYLSLVFQIWWMYVNGPADLNADSILAGMLDDPWRHQCDNWFKDDLGAATGVDVFAQPFPTERGWEIYENDNARVLIIRQENLDRLPEALGKLYGISATSVKMENRNRGDEKDYSNLYAAVKRAWRPTEPVLDEVYSAEYVRHFYTSKEIESYKHRWRTSATRQERTGSQVPKPAATKSDPPQSIGNLAELPSKNLTHDRSCHPCPQCAQEIESVPELQKACQERLEIIERLQSFWPVKIMQKCSKIYKRLFRGSHAAK
jgi:hypothetical protein